jgi:hypothetical protein
VSVVDAHAILAKGLGDSELHFIATEFKQIAFGTGYFSRVMGQGYGVFGAFQ